MSPVSQELSADFVVAEDSCCGLLLSAMLLLSLVAARERATAVAGVVVADDEKADAKPTRRKTKAETKNVGLLLCILFRCTSIDNNSDKVSDCEICQDASLECGLVD